MQCPCTPGELPRLRLRARGHGQEGMHAGPCAAPSQQLAASLLSEGSGSFRMSRLYRIRIETRPATVHGQAFEASHGSKGVVDIIIAPDMQSCIASEVGQAVSLCQSVA